MAEKTIDGLLNTSFQNLKHLVDADSIIGQPMTMPTGETIIPVSKVSFGFVSGGSDIATAKQPKELFGGGSGGGVTIEPVAFIVIANGDVKLLTMSGGGFGTVERIIDQIPTAVDKITSTFKKD